MSDSIEWHVIHEEIVALARDRARHEHALGRALLRARQARVWQPLGMATLGEYAERYLGLTPRQTEERVRVAEALGTLPLLDRALAAGDLHFSAVHELTRVALPETEHDWIEAIREMAVADIEKLASGRAPGDLPGDPERPRRHRVVLDLSPETYALYREAQAKLRRESDESLSEDDGLNLMARRVLGGPGDNGRSSYQIQMTLCGRCGRGAQEGRGQAIAVGPETVAQAKCDAQRVEGRRATQDIPPATRRLVATRQHGRCGAPGCRNATFTDVHHVIPRADGGTHDPDGLLLLCSAHHAAAHRGMLRVEGRWSTGFQFRHADGSPYGAVASARSAGLVADLHRALRSLGFHERETRTMVDAARPHMGADTTIEAALRTALLARELGGARPEQASSPLR